MDFPRYNVLGVGLHALDLPRATRALVEASADLRGAYVCCCDAHSISCARTDPRHRQTLNRAFLTTPDGMPLVWLGRLAGHRDTHRVYGPDLLNAVCAATADGSRSHFFYGGEPGVAETLAECLHERHPSLRIVGTHTPPHTDDVTAMPLNAIALARPDFLWIGLSTPKQERLLRHLAEQHGSPAHDLDFGIALGVGAAFDFVTGRVRQAPLSVQRSGFEWLWRLTQEPTRLTRRYLRTIPTFAARSVAQIAGWQHYPLED